MSGLNFKDTKDTSSNIQVKVQVLVWAGTGNGEEKASRKKSSCNQLLTPKPWPRIICISCNVAIQFICSASILLQVAAGIYLLVLEKLALLTGTCRTIIIDGMSGRSHAYTSAVGLVYLFGCEAVNIDAKEQITVDFIAD